MFRRRLTIALACLAAAVVLQSAAALWALSVADQHARHGRVTSDIHLGFVELSATKQRLRTWVSQALLGAGAATDERDRLQADLTEKLAQLRGLSEQAIALGQQLGPDDRQAQLQRRVTLDVLGRGFERLAGAIDAVQALPPGANAQEAWNTLSTVFDVSEGQNLRALIAESIARAAASEARERDAADRTLRWMRGLWLGTAGGLALAALLVAWHFARRLRQPLTDLTRGAEALQRGELEHRIPERQRDEFSTVARSVNALAAELKQHRQGEAEARLKLQDQVDARTSELRDALATLQQADARRRQLFADISHELRSPTTAIRGEAEVTLRGAARPVAEYRDALQRIVETSRQLGLVIDDLLTMARSDIDALSLVREPLDPAVPLAEALAQTSALARQRGVQLTLAPAPPDGLRVLGDGQRLRQLLLLLLDNAVRYSHPNGQVQVGLAPCHGDGGQAQCAVTVADQGIGIPAEALPHVFERNYRAPQARLHRADGTGLGLAIGAVLARAHGGSITIDSPPQGGTIATLRLPLMGGPPVPLHSP